MVAQVLNKEVGKSGAKWCGGKMSFRQQRLE